VTQVSSQVLKEVFGTAKVGAAVAAVTGASAAPTRIADARIALMRFINEAPNI
jgi:hypothetical protein